MINLNSHQNVGSDKNHDIKIKIDNAFILSIDNNDSL